METKLSVKKNKKGSYNKSALNHVANPNAIYKDF